MKDVDRPLSAKPQYTLKLIAQNYEKEPLKYILVIIIVLITAVKLNLIGTGFLAYPDEFRYMSSRKALHDLSEFNIRGAFIDISSTNGRPGDAVLKMIPNSIQYLTAHIFKLNYYESENSAPLFIFNF